MGFRDIIDMYQNFYPELQRLRDKDSPQTYMILSPSLEQLKSRATTEARKHKIKDEPDQRIGEGRPVAWVYRIKKKQLIVICQDGGYEAVQDYIREWMGLPV